MLKNEINEFKNGKIIDKICEKSVFIKHSWSQ